MIGDTRYYKGIRQCVIASSISPTMKTVKVKWEDGSFGIVPNRMCWRHKK